MSERINLAELRATPVVAPDDHSMTRFAPFVQMTPETLLALVEAVEAAQKLAGHLTDTIADEFGFGEFNFDPALKRLEAALARFDFEEQP